jgi:tetratricopeptide (TPR) repeat protein
MRNAQHGLFRKEGEYWAVGYDGKAIRLRDTRGLAYLAHLLRHPAAEFHVLDLVGAIEGQSEQEDAGHSVESLPRNAEDLEKAGIHVTRLGDAGEMLDEQAKRAYKQRLFELREQLEEAKELENVERAAQAEQEIDALTRELSRAVGLGGRNRQAASASERARQSITKSIKSVLERIGQSDAQLGILFSRCIKTGIFCSYQPDPDIPIVWEFAPTDRSSAIAPVVEANASSDLAPTRADHSQAPPVVLEAFPFSRAERTAFVGREPEASAICAVIDRALTGQGSLIMLWGEPGVGKTRLAMEMAEYASRIGFRCTIGRCYEGGEPLPYHPCVEIIEHNLAQSLSLDDYLRQWGGDAALLAHIAPSLRRSFPEIPEPLELPPGQQRRYIFQSVSKALAHSALKHPYLYVLEDLHWADDSMLALLIHLANRVAQLPVMIIGTYRSEYSEGNPALGRTLEELIRMGIRPLKLSDLSRDAVGRMINSLSQSQAPESLVSRIFEQSQGNPFFVEELYRHLIEDRKVFDASGQFRTDIEIDGSDIPETVRLIIGRRLERFDDNEKQVLAAAATIGRSFSFQLLTAISLVDIDELFAIIEKAQQMGIIVPSSEGAAKPFTFAHELVRQTLLTRISASRQQQLHASIARAIELVYPDAVDDRAGEIADHLLKAGSFADRHALVRWLTLAGKAAIEVAAFEEGRRSFQSALSHLAPADVREKADLLTHIAIAEGGLERWDTALSDLREALEIYINLK